VFVDNYLDGGYHVSFLHKDLTSGLDIDSYKTEVSENFSLQKVQGNGDQDRLGKNAVFAYLFPNMMINRYGPWMDTNVVFPTGKTNS
jgi:choline monooxygenase